MIFLKKDIQSINMWKKSMQMEDSDDEDMSNHQPNSKPELSQEQKFCKLIDEKKLTDEDILNAAHSNFLWKYLKGDNYFIQQMVKKPSEYKGVIDPELVGEEPKVVLDYLSERYKNLEYKALLWLSILNSDPMCISAIPKELFEKHREYFTQQFADQYKGSVKPEILRDKAILHYVGCPHFYNNFILRQKPQDVELEHIMKAYESELKPYRNMFILIGLGSRDESDDECLYAHLQEKLTDEHVDAYLNECKDGVFQGNLIPRKFRTEERLMKALDICKHVFFPQDREYSQEFWNKYASLNRGDLEKIPDKYLTSNIYFARIKINPQAICQVPNEFKTREMCKFALENSNIYKAVKDFI